MLTKRRAVALVRKTVKGREDYVAKQRYVSAVDEFGERREAFSSDINNGTKIIPECIVGEVAVNDLDIKINSDLVGGYALADTLISDHMPSTRGARYFLVTVQRLQDGRLRKEDVPVIESVGGVVNDDGLHAANTNRLPWGIAFQAALKITEGKITGPREHFGDDLVK